MGIHLLQTFISSLNDRSIKEQHLRHFTGKTISVDISIYLYRFKEMGNLLENIYLMCSIFRHYNITAIFIFDGKPLKFFKAAKNSQSFLNYYFFLFSRYLI